MERIRRGWARGGLWLGLLLLIASPALSQFEGREKARREREGKGRERTYEEKWTLDPANEDPEWRRAHELYATGHYDETLELFEKFLKESPNEVSVACSMGGIYWDLGDYARAEKWFDRALEIVPRHVEARKFKARMFYQMARWTEAEKIFKELLTFENLRPDIRGSANLNLGKIALLRRRFRNAARHFIEAAKSPRKGHRSQAEKGRLMVVRFRRTLMWQSEETKGLRVFFSPDIPAAGGKAGRRAFAERCQTALDRICRTLGMSFKEKLPLYVFKDEGQAYEITGQDLPTWKYSWWILATAWDRDPGYDIALQAVARVRGFRPSSKILVTGLAAYAAGLPNPHERARKLLAKGRLRTLAEMHVRQTYDLEEARPYGQSFVTWVIDTYGMDRFLESYAWFKLVLLDPVWRSKATGRMDWSGALTAIFRRGIGEDYPALERRWRDFLRGR